MKYIDLKQILNDLRKNIEGNEQEKKNIQNLQQMYVMLLIAIIQDQKDNLLRLQIINSGIAQQLINTFLVQPFQQISQYYSNLFLQLTHSSNEIRFQLFNLNPYPSLLRLLEHKDIQVVQFTICSIFNILITGQNSTPKTFQHPHFQIMIENDGINKIFKIFKRKGINKDSKDKVTYCIGRLLRALEIQNPEMKKEIISHLISIMADPDNDYKKNAKVSLEYLAQNSGNLTEIMKYIDLKQILNDLRKNIEGNELEKKLILNQQETDCLLLILIAQNQRNDSFKQQIINSGIGQELINIFSNQPIEQISQFYSKIFFYLTYTTSNETELSLFNLNPYPSLLRLLEHKDIEIVDQVIRSIYNILLSGSNTTPLTSQHPHFQIIIENDGIKKIFKMYQRKDILICSKENATYCLCNLFRAQEITKKQMKKQIIQSLIQIILDIENEKKHHSLKSLKGLVLNQENLKKILKYINLNNISNDLQQPLTGNDAEKQIIIRKLQNQCQLLQALLNNREDTKLRKKLIKAGIVDGILKIISSWNLDLITLPIVQCLFAFVYPYSYSICKLLVEKKPFPSLHCLFDHNDTTVVLNVITIVNNILQAGAIGSSPTSIHPYYEDLNQLGGIEKIFSLFKITQDEFIKNSSAISLGIVFRARDITDHSMKFEIISHLKSIINHPKEDIRNKGRLALKCLVQNSRNRSDIEKDGFKIPEY